MNSSSTKNLPPRSSQILPWLHFFGAILVFVILSLFTAIHSELGNEISAGESSGFAWISVNIIKLLWVGSGYLVFVFWIQHRQSRIKPLHFPRITAVLVLIEFLSIAAIAIVLFYAWYVFLPAVHTVLLTSILLQGVLALDPNELPGLNAGIALLQKPERNTGLFMVLLFFFGAVLIFIDPTWNPALDRVLLQTDIEYFLGAFLPPIFSGFTSLWFGMALVAILTISRALRSKLFLKLKFEGISLFVPFFFIATFYAVVLLGTLSHAIQWEISKLNLKPAILQLIILTGGCGSALLSVVFCRITGRMPQAQNASAIGVVSLTFGAAIFLPITWLATLGQHAKRSWILLLVAIFGGSLLVVFFVLSGNIFNPWFTAFSYLKGAILKTTTVVAAGIGLLVLEQLSSFRLRNLPTLRRQSAVMLIIIAIGFLPFSALERFPEAKVAILQFNELTRIDVTYAREVINFLGLGRWIRIGQDPKQNNFSNPWPLPWHLKKTHPSLLPENFNLLIIVVDSLRGDAFHSAGYHRNLTPFLDRWARKEAVSFRRAYSQGGGSFAALPFLVAGRSRFALYGPNLYRENLYFKIAQAERIQHYMVMKGFGPRAIFPPEYPVMELSIPRAVSDRHSATAEEVFDSARKTIGALPQGERFLCFLHLMDVHNDLWKKENGIDFGNSPRDLYDNNLSYLDRAFSRFVSWLKQAGLYGRTVILFTSDHGEQFWEHGASLHGHTLYEEEIRIPLILHVQGISGRFENVPVVAADMGPTIAELAGYSVDPPYDDSHMGISLVPLILRNDRKRYLQRDVVGRASFKRRYFLYRNWEWKLVYLAELDLLQLFNTAKDPMEKNNLLQEEPELAAEMEKELFAYLEKVEGKKYRPLLSDSSVSVHP
jgi:hypothetical protein